MYIQCKMEFIRYHLIIADKNLSDEISKDFTATINRLVINFRVSNLCKYFVRLLADSYLEWDFYFPFYFPVFFSQLINFKDWNVSFGESS